MAKHQRKDSYLVDDLIGHEGKKNTIRELHLIEGWINHQYSVDPEGIERIELVDNVNDVEYKYHIMKEDTTETHLN